MTPPSSSANTTCTWRAKKAKTAKDRGTIAAFGPILVPTIRWEKGDKTAKRMIKGTARKIEVILSKIQKTALFSKTPPGAVKTRKRPATSPKKPPMMRKELSYKELGRWLFPSLPDQPSPSYRHLANRFESMIPSYCPPFNTFSCTPAWRMASWAPASAAFSPDKTTTNSPTGVPSRISIFP